jgi:hypothetical protein
MGSSEPMIPIEDKLSSVADKRGYTLRRRNAKKLIPVYKEIVTSGAPQIASRRG